MSKRLPINCAARNSVWVYDRAVPPRFPGAPTIMETTRSHEMPDIDAVPEGSDIAVEIFGGSIVLRLDGLQHRISTERFRWVYFANEQEARVALASLWNRVEMLESAVDIRIAVEVWRDEVGDKGTSS